MKSLIVAVVAMACAALCALAACNTATPPPSTAADFTEGMRAYEQQDYATALREFRPLAEQGDANAQYRLGHMYSQGQGVHQDFRQAAVWFTKAAERGNVVSQLSLGRLYLSGISDEVIPRDFLKAAEWFRKAAAKGHWLAQHMLGLMYEVGSGVPQDPILAYAWYNLAATQGNDGVRKARQDLTKRMTDEQITIAQQFSGKLHEWIVAGGDGPPPRLVSYAKEKQNLRVWGTGSGFLVDQNLQDAWIVTNEHVVGDCDRVTIYWDGISHSAEVEDMDEYLDLALLKAPSKVGEEAATFSQSRRVGRGAGVVAAGYPLQGQMSVEELTVTYGEVNNLVGPKGDRKRLQFQASIQGGNSGGPLLDYAGNVIGVVASKFNPVINVDPSKGTHEIVIDSTQNVNFAIKGGMVRGFLDNNAGVEYDRRPSKEDLTGERLAELAETFTVPIWCWRGDAP